MRARVPTRPSCRESRSGLARSAWLGAAILFLTVFLAGCNLRGQKPVAETPPAPKPVVVPQPAPEPQLSTPQTTVQLPSPQMVNPDAVPKVPADPPRVAEKAEPAPPPRPKVRPAGTQAKADPEPETTPPPAAPAVEEHPPFQPILSAEEQRRLQNAIEVRKHQIDELLNRAKGRPTSQNQSLVDRINSFLTLSAQAAQRGDFTQADALSERALILARELQVE